MTEREFIIWLRGHMMEANYADQFNWEIINRLIQIRSEQRKYIQLEIPFPDYPDKELTKTIWVSDSTSGTGTYSTTYVDTFTNN
jgi:hypothetical protein